MQDETPPPLQTHEPRMRIRPLWWVGGIVAAGLIAVGAWLFFGVFAFHLIWVDEVVEEEAPEFVAAQSEAEEPETMATGSFISRAHATSGTINVLSDGTQTFLRFEDDFRTDNGPDLDIYLSTTPPDGPGRDFANDFINLGDMKGNIGSQNYEIPAGTDLSVYNTVVVWCVRFNVVFGAGSLDLS